MTGAGGSIMSPYLPGTSRDKDNYVSNAVKLALSQLGEPIGENNLEELEELTSQLKGNLSYTRGGAVRTLSEIGGAQVVAPLISAMEDDHFLSIRASAVQALIKVGEPAVKLLIETLKDTAHRNRGGAAQALGAIGN